MRACTGMGLALASALLLFGCSKDESQPVPSAHGVLELGVAYDGSQGAVDATHPIRAYLFAGSQADGRGAPVADAMTASNPDTLRLARLAPGVYTAWVFYDAGANACRQPSPCRSVPGIAVGVDSTARAAAAFGDETRAARIVGGPPRPDQEAEEMALWLSGDLTAPPALYARLAAGLGCVRQGFGENTPELDRIRFSAPWQPGRLSFLVTRAVRDQIRAGTYHALDSLNQALGLAYMDTTPDFATHARVSLTFTGRLHPQRLAELYAKVPSLSWISIDGLSGDAPCVYPWVRDARITFLFRDAWGDCPVGCIHSLYWYFDWDDTDCRLLGAWDPRLEDTPGWWSEARAAMVAYQSWK
jgi:hypothetical protein